MSRARPVLVIGGAGFIGSNLAHHLLARGHAVRILDNLSRPGVAQNLDWLRAGPGPDRAGGPGARLDVHIGDLRDRATLRHAVRGVSAVFHLAAQVAVTASLRDPIHDFEVNVRGTLDLLEALRALREAGEEPPPLVFASTNKVYGDLEDLALEELALRYQPVDPMLRARGVSERQGLCFRSPYGCSKGAADQYVLDYARTFGLPATVFRMSCIYGPHQLGTEEQGWVAHFLRCAIEGTGVTIFGDGKQVRDVLFIDDLVDAFVRAWRGIDALAGRPFNIGGSAKYGISLIDLLDLIEELRGEPVDVRLAPWRPGDQRYYVSDIQAFRDATGWYPRTDVRAGVRALHAWLLGRHMGQPGAGAPGAGAPSMDAPGAGAAQSGMEAAAAGAPGAPAAPTMSRP